MTALLTTTALAALKTLVPPPALVLSTWLEENLILPSDSALPGRLKLTTVQRGIADAISDPSIEKVTVVKPVRAGYTLIESGGILAYMINDPKSQILLFATDRNCREYVTSHLEPLIAASPTLRGLLGRRSRRDHDRNTMCSRRSRMGGSIKVLPTTAENTLRGHTCSRLWGDEIDAMDPGSEGSPLKLGERRTLTFRRPEDRLWQHAEIFGNKFDLEVLRRKRSKNFRMVVGLLRYVRKARMGIRQISARLS